MASTSYKCEVYENSAGGKAMSDDAGAEQQEGLHPSGVDVNSQQPNTSTSSGKKKTYTHMTQLMEKKRKWPILFERADRRWWNPKFNSRILEAQHWRSSFPRIQKRLMVIILYLMIACVSWIVFIASLKRDQWVSIVVGFTVLIFICIVMLLFIRSKFFEMFYFPLSVFLTTILCGLSLILLCSSGVAISVIGTFSMVAIILLLMYAVLPMPLYVSIFLGSIFLKSYYFNHSPRQLALF